MLKNQEGGRPLPPVFVRCRAQPVEKTLLELRALEGSVGKARGAAKEAILGLYHVAEWPDVGKALAVGEGHEDI